MVKQFSLRVSLTIMKNEKLLKVEFSPSRKILLYLLQCKPFKNDVKCLLFHLKTSFRSQDI